MRLLIRPHQFPTRLIPGLYILDAGLGMRGADEQKARGLLAMASGAYPFLKGQDPVRFARLLAYGEIAVGALLVAPFVPTALAGAALTAFGGGLAGVYLRTPGMRKEGGLSPTPEGVGLSKDLWLLAIGLSLTMDGLLNDRGCR